MFGAKKPKCPLEMRRFPLHPHLPTLSTSPPSLLPYQLVNFVCLWSVSDAAYQGDSPTQTYDGIFPESEKIYTYIRILALAREDPYPPPLYPFPLPPFILPIYSPSLYTDQQKYIFLTKIQAYIISTLFVLRRSIN